MEAQAIIFEEPHRTALAALTVNPPGADDVVVDMEWSGVSTGTERLLWSGRMPAFPGMGYPLVPGYESVGRIVEAGTRSGRRVGERVFVPGANCYSEAKGLFGGTSSRVVIAGAKAVPVDESLGERAILLGLAATAHHAIAPDLRRLPDLIVGHGVLGRLIARIACAAGGRPTVWELDPARRQGGEGYEVVDPDADTRRDYRHVCDASGDPDILDALVLRLARGGEIVLAGFYDRRVSFSFPPAFMREAQIRIAAEWRRNDLTAVAEMAASGRLSLDGLITHRASPERHADAYATAFTDVRCLKMVFDWGNLAWTH